MTIAEIVVSSPDLILAPTIRAGIEVGIERERHPIPAAGEDATLLLFVSVEGDFDEFDRAVARDPTVADPRITADYGDSRVYCVTVTDRAVVVSTRLAELGIQTLDAHSYEHTGWQLRTLLPSRDVLTAFKEYCDDAGISFTLRTMYRKEEAGKRGGSGLTDAQYETLLTARERGYFDDPRRVSLRELGDEAGVSPSAMGRRIRRATARLIDTSFGRDE